MAWQVAILPLTSKPPSMFLARISGDVAEGLYGVGGWDLLVPLRRPVIGSMSSGISM
jgi:hypothetical protein